MGSDREERKKSTGKERKTDRRIDNDRQRDRNRKDEERDEKVCVLCNNGKWLRERDSTIQGERETEADIENGEGGERE